MAAARRAGHEALAVDSRSRTGSLIIWASRCADFARTLTGLRGAAREAAYADLQAGALANARRGRDWRGGEASELAVPELEDEQGPQQLPMVSALRVVLV